MIERAFDRASEQLRNLKYAYVRARIRSKLKQARPVSSVQALDVYSDPTFDATVSTWAEKSAWIEVQHLLAPAEGPILDVACGAGNAILKVRRPARRVLGCDISHYLLELAASRGVARDDLSVCDATRLPYRNDAFECSYSIGSLEHFTSDGIDQMLGECARVTRWMSCHQIPTSRSGRDEGWIALTQSYFNNSPEWWRQRFARQFSRVEILDSTWEDAISVGKWLIGYR